MGPHGQSCAEARAGDGALPRTFVITTLIFAIALLIVVPFAAILVALAVGRRVGAQRLKHDPDGAAEGMGALDGAIYGLMGLLLAFTFSGAAARFDARRDLITRETNAIGTAYLRLAVLPPQMQPQLRREFRDYVDARIAVFANRLDAEASARAGARSNALQNTIWSDAIVAAKATNSPAVLTLVLTSLNDMIDITTERAVALETHPPTVIFILLGVAILVSSLFAGYSMGVKRSQSLLHILGFAVIMTTSLYVIVDMEYPRVGIIRIDPADRILYDFRATMQ